MKRIPIDNFWRMFPRWYEFWFNSSDYGRRFAVRGVFDLEDGWYRMALQCKREGDCFSWYYKAPQDPKSERGYYSHDKLTDEERHAIQEAREKAQRETFRIAFEKVDKDKLREFLADVDGHTFLHPQFFLEMGFEKAFVDGATRDHITQPDNPLSIIFNQDGKQLEHCVAVYDLEFLHDLAKSLGVRKSRGFIGRGREASALADAILAFLDTGQTFFQC